jgi:hypothetical protein
VEVSGWKARRQVRDARATRSSRQYQRAAQHAGLGHEVHRHAALQRVFHGAGQLQPRR